MRTPNYTAYRILLAALTPACIAPAFAAGATKPETTFTLAAIPDTQNYLDYSHQTAEGFPFDANELFYAQLRYVARNLKSQGGDIAFVTALGDVWQHATLEIDPAHAARGFKAAPNPATAAMGLLPTPKALSVETPAAKRGYELIAGKTPFSVVPGNHDYDATWTDANHPPAAKITTAASRGVLHVGGLNNFKTVFSDQSAFFKGQPWYVAAHDDGADSAQIFVAGGYRFLHIGLQFDPPSASLEWAASVIKRFPGLPTIISTHDYLNTAGERLANPIIDNSVVDPQDNSPQMVWDKLISQHDQIFLVLCGHEHGQAFRNDRNHFGHTVYQVLSDYQDRGHIASGVTSKSGAKPRIGDGWLRLMQFDMGAKTPCVQVRTYSTYYQTFSTDLPEYVQWYKPVEQPKFTDEAFEAGDDFVIEMEDFRQRFGKAEVGE